MRNLGFLFKRFVEILSCLFNRLVFPNPLKHFLDVAAILIRESVAEICKIGGACCEDEKNSKGYRNLSCALNLLAPTLDPFKLRFDMALNPIN